MTINIDLAIRKNEAAVGAEKRSLPFSCPLGIFDIYVEISNEQKAYINEKLHVMPANKCVSPV